MKNIKLILLFSILSIKLWSQTETCTISGKIVDTSGMGLALASVMLLDPKDSTLLEYDQASDLGVFSFKNVARRSYLLKVNYISFIPLQKIISPNGKTLDLGKLTMMGISKELFEVVIKAAKAPMTIKGDTIEYDASTFKVPAGSTVEDLLRRLPGLEVDQQGGITADGKNVNRVTVDGKSFFGGDPKAATKNLPAEGIAKVQVFSDLTEEQKITGQRRLNSDKAMNLELKEDFKKGGFGKIIASIGTENTKELKGNYNKFNAKHQFSIIGSGTNTGRNGLSWNDYQDFKGSSSFNWGDDGNFGFANGSNYRFMVFDEGDDDESSIVNSFFGGDNYGFPVKVSTGVNYNFDNKKTKLSSMYFYDLSNLHSTSLRTQNFLIPENPYNTFDTASRDNNKMSHRVELRLEQEIDSFSSIVIKSNHSIGLRNSITNNNSKSFDPNNLILNDQIGTSNQDSKNINSQNSLIYRRKFKKKGRSMGVSAAYTYNQSNKDADAQNTNSFYQLAIRDSTSNLNQNYLSNQNVNTYKASALWQEPVGKYINLRTFYNFNNGNTDYERTVSDIENSMLKRNDYLSRTFLNTNQYNRIGQGISFNNKGFEINLGLAYQEILLKSEFKSGLDTMSIFSSKVYPNYVPNFEINYEIPNGFETGFEFSRNVYAPNSKDLLPIVDNTNPLAITIGNPELQPRLSNDLRYTIRKFNRLNFTNLWASIGYSYFDRDIIYEREVSINRINSTKPINISGTNSINGNLNYGFPIVKNKFTINVGYNYNYKQDKAITNGILNEPKIISNGVNLRINVSPSDKFTFFISSNGRQSYQLSNTITKDSSYVTNIGTTAELNFKFKNLIFFNSNFNLSKYTTNFNGYTSTIPILNLSVYKLFFKENKGEVRLSVYDLFNKTVGIQQNLNSNRLSQVETQTLARYFLLSFTYNMRGIKSSLEKNDRRRMMY